MSFLKFEFLNLLNLAEFGKPYNTMSATHLCPHIISNLCQHPPDPTYLSNLQTYLSCPETPLEHASRTSVLDRAVLGMPSWRKDVYAMEDESIEFFLLSSLMQRVTILLFICIKLY